MLAWKDTKKGLILKLFKTENLYLNKFNQRFSKLLSLTRKIKRKPKIKFQNQLFN